MTKTRQAVEAAVYRIKNKILEHYDGYGHGETRFANMVSDISDEIESALRAELASQQDVAAPVSPLDVFHQAWGDAKDAPGYDKAAFVYVQPFIELAASRVPGALVAEPGNDPDRWADAAMPPDVERRLAPWLTNGAALHPLTINLVVRFARAMAAKLSAAEVKYGYSDGWLRTDWMDECRAKLLEHVAKGDPRDVAAYCAFLWHHGESTATPSGGAGCSVGAVSAEVAQSIEYRLWVIKEWAGLHLGAGHNITIAANSAHAEVAYSATPAASVPLGGGEVPEKHKLTVAAHLMKLVTRACAEFHDYSGLRNNWTGGEALKARKTYRATLDEIEDGLRLLAAQPTTAQDAKDAIRDVLYERARQVEVWGNDHDDEHGYDILANGAAEFLMPGQCPMKGSWSYKSKVTDRDPRRVQIVKGAAVAVAAIEAYDRAAILASEKAPGTAGKGEAG